MDNIRHYTMLIGGDWVDSDDQFEIRSPATEDLVATVAKGAREHADRAVAAAKAAHEEGRWRRTAPLERAAVLDAIADRLSERIDELAVLETQENGAPVRQARAFQIGFSVAHLRYFADQARSYSFERVATIRIGDPLDLATDLGPVTSAEARDRILAYIDSGVREGATLACGGGVPAGPQSTTGTWSAPPTRSAASSRAGWAASSGRTPWTNTPRSSSSTSTCPAGSTAGPTRCCSARHRPE